MATEFAEVPVHFWNRITLKEKALFYEHLSNLIDGGVTFIDALRSFCEKTENPLFYKYATELLMLVESGDIMSNAMKKLPRAFDRGEVSIIEAGEQSGTLQRSFSSLAEDLRNQETLSSKLKGALVYPAIILAFLVAAIMVIMVFVVPKLLPLFENAGTELPAVTVSLIATSNFVANNFLIIVFGIAGLVIGIFSYIKTYQGRKHFDTIILRVPLIGRVYRNYLIVRVSTTLGLLLGAGIPIIKTLRLTGESTNNLVYEEAVLQVSNLVESGMKIAESFEKVDPKHQIFTQDFIQLVGAGEKTSTINKVCVKIATQYTREVDASVTMLVKFVEPGAILFAGIFVLWFAFAIFSAVLKITDTVG